MAVHFPRARDRDLIWVETPFHEPAPKVVVAAARAGAFGLLDLGPDAARARAALDVVVGRTDAPFGVRVSELCALDVSDLPDAVHTVVVSDTGLIDAVDLTGYVELPSDMIDATRSTWDSASGSTGSTAGTGSTGTT